MFRDPFKEIYIDLTKIVNNVCFSFTLYSEDSKDKKQLRKLASLFIDEISKISSNLKEATALVKGIILQKYYDGCLDFLDFDGESYQNAYLWLEKLIYWYYGYIETKKNNPSLLEQVKQSIEKQFEESLTYEQKLILFNGNGE